MTTGFASSACDFWAFTRLVQDPNLRLCEADSRYELLPPKLSPIDAQMIRICACNSCRKLWRHALSLNFTECTIGSLHLRADVVDKVAAFCSSVNTNTSSDGSLQDQQAEIFATEGPVDMVSVPSNDSPNTRPSPSVIVGVVLGSLLLGICALIAAILLQQQRKRTRLDDRVTSQPRKKDPCYGDDQLASDDFCLMVVDQLPPPPGTSAGVIQAILADPHVFTTRLPMNSIQKQTLIGQGAYGCVYQANFQGQRVAIKTLRAEYRKSLAHIAGLLHEVQLMASLEHPNIVRFIGLAWEALVDLCVVVEFMGRGDLRSLLVQFERSGKPRGMDVQKIRLAHEIANGLTYLHSLDPVILHRDLKSKNVLLNDQLHAKLTDFGISRVATNRDETLTAAVGTSLWMAPEVMLGGHYDEKADMFSFGVVLSELDTHQYPYSSHRSDDKAPKQTRRSELALLQQIATGAVCVTFSATTSPEVLAIASKCLRLDPKERPSASQVAYELYLVSRRTGLMDTMIHTCLQ